jgi:rare lipoprotein A
MPFAAGSRPAARAVVRDRFRTSRAWVTAGLILAGCAQFPASPGPEPAPAVPAQYEARPGPQVESPTPAPKPSAATPAPPESRDAAPKAETSPAWRQQGQVSHYGDGFAGKPTANGDTFDPARLTMAHRTLPFGTRVRVTNLENHQSVEVVVNDRGPFVQGRIADLSTAAARRLGMLTDGVVDAVIEVVEPAKGH